MKGLSSPPPLFDVPASIFVKAERTDINNLSSLNGKTIAMAGRRLRKGVP